LLLTLEVATSWRSTNGAARKTPADPRDEHRKSTLGRAAHARRDFQARHRYRTDERGQVYGQGRGPPSQGWKTFLNNHADGIAAMDLFVVPTISFRLLYGLLIMGHGRRRFYGLALHRVRLHNGSQIREACGWEQAPRYLIRDRDGAYGKIFVRRLRSIGIRD
jgi:hypothetical protein